MKTLMAAYKIHLYDIYDKLLKCIDTDLKEHYDYDIYLMYKDVKLFETKMYIIRLSLNILEKSKHIVCFYGNNMMIPCAVFDIVFKYVIDIEYHFLIVENLDLFCKIQYDILQNCKWIIKLNE